MEYIKVPNNIIIDYIPKDFKVCSKCIYEGICPYEYTCPSLNRIRDAERKLKE